MLFLKLTTGTILGGSMKKLLFLFVPLLIVGFGQTHTMDTLKILVQLHYDFAGPDFYVYMHKDKTVADLNAAIAERTHNSPEEQILLSWMFEVYNHKEKLRNLDLERQKAVRLKLKPKPKIIPTPQKSTPPY